jgi:hypothetical protein
MFPFKIKSIKSDVKSPQVVNYNKAINQLKSKRFKNK